MVSHEQLINPLSENLAEMDLPPLNSILCVKSVVSLELPDSANTNTGHPLRVEFQINNEYVFSNIY